MFDQKFEDATIPEGSLLARYVQGQREMNRLHEGVLLRSAAESVLAQLPDGPLTLLATSASGAGLAAACAALRNQPTTWRQVDLVGIPLEATDPVVVVDTIDAGDGWRAALLGRFPSAMFVVPETIDAELGLAA
jgi:hypothetical protein